MSNTSKVFLNSITDDVVIEILKSVIPILEKRKVEYFLVGAFARDIGLSAAGHKDAPPRKTEDLDLAVLVGSIEEYEGLIGEFLKSSDYEPHSEPYRLIFRKAYEVDLLPFGEIEEPDGTVKLRTFELNMPGFDEVFPDVKSVETNEGLNLKFSSLPGVILLKLLAFADRPESRQKDIRDIDYILNHFYDFFIEEIMSHEDDLLDLYENEEALFDRLVSARYIGKKIGAYLSTNKSLEKRITEIFEKESKSQRMIKLMSRTNLDDNRKIIEALLKGIND